MTQQDDLPLISVVVCTHNRAGLLKGALASLYNLATDGRFTYEVVVIDNASTDETPQTIVAAAEESRNPLRGVREAEQGIVAARNRGIREAHGQWIAFFDDDQLADSRWLVELYLGAVEQRCRVVGGAVHLALPEGCQRQLDPAVRMLLGEARLGQRFRYGRRLTPGCGNLMVERKVFEQVGVFQRTVHGRGEDTELFTRIEQAGLAAWYVPTAIIHHITPAERLQDAYLLELARRMGEGVAERQAAQFSPTWFALLRLGKALRTKFVQQPLAAADRWLGNHEAWLGWQCLIVLNQAFLRHRPS
jgi:glycosyltransferase involved in cell wall biosynthesis